LANGILAIRSCSTLMQNCASASVRSVSNPTHLRKFALFIHIDGWGSVALGKTCHYCSRCEMIMVHRDELEKQLAHSLTQIAPEAVGNV
jgi:hypothetical protein